MLGRGMLGPEMLGPGCWTRDAGPEMLGTRDTGTKDAGDQGCWTRDAGTRDAGPECWDLGRSFPLTALGEAEPWLRDQSPAVSSPQLVPRGATGGNASPTQSPHTLPTPGQPPRQP